MTEDSHPLAPDSPRAGLTPGDGAPGEDGAERNPVHAALDAYLRTNPHHEEAVDAAFANHGKPPPEPEVEPEPEPEPEQLPLLVPSDQQKARTTDPDTSHAAAASVAMRTGSIRAKLLVAFYDRRYHEGLTDEEAAQQSDTYLRPDGYLTEFATRCSELRNLGLIRETDRTRRGTAGKERLVSEITQAGIAFVLERKWR